MLEDVWYVGVAEVGELDHDLAEASQPSRVGHPGKPGASEQINNLLITGRTHSLNRYTLTSINYNDLSNTYDPL